jgi:hypothetical protein
MDKVAHSSGPRSVSNIWNTCNARSIILCTNGTRKKYDSELVLRYFHKDWRILKPRLSERDMTKSFSRFQMGWQGKLL